MIRAAAIAMVSAAFVGSAVCADYPLTFEKIPTSEVMGFPGGYGSYSQVNTRKPTHLKIPKTISRRPLYGVWSVPHQKNRDVLLDESKGNGKGYDSLVIDMNGNSDLTDDAPVPSVKMPGQSSTVNPDSMRQAFFGPIEMSNEVLGCKPVYYSHVYIAPRSVMSSGQYEESSSYAGHVSFRCAWYLGSTVEFDGKKTKFALYDSDGNGSIGDGPQTVTYKSGTEDHWYAGGGDNFLVDVNGSGKFESDMLDREVATFGDIVYVGCKPYKVRVGKDFKQVTVEPWTGDLAEVQLKPRGAEIQSVVLARQQTADKWLPLSIQPQEGAVRVPPGKYRFMRCVVAGKADGCERVVAGGSQSQVKAPFEAVAGKTATLTCGGTLRVRVEAETRAPQPWEQSRTPAKNTDSDKVLAIGAKVLGEGGEVYSMFGAGDKLDKTPPQPTFVVTCGGKEVAKGNLEFG